MFPLTVKYFTTRISARVGVRNKKRDDAGIARPVIKNVTGYSDPSFVLMSFRFLPGSYASGRSVMDQASCILSCGSPKSSSDFFHDSSPKELP